jgi:hypothetical protein
MTDKERQGGVSTEGQGGGPVETVQQTPGYHLGFYEAAQGYPLFDDATDDYEAGWRGLHEAKAILRADSGRDASGLLAALKGALASLQVQAATARHRAKLGNTVANMGLAEEIERNVATWQAAIAAYEAPRGWDKVEGGTVQDQEKAPKPGSIFPTLGACLIAALLLAHGGPAATHDPCQLPEQLPEMQQHEKGDCPAIQG